MAAPGWWRALPDGKRISALGFGCSSLWAKPDFDEARAQDVLDAAAEGGINHFDTAPSYGAGHGERRLGAFLTRTGAEGHVVSTKIGTNLVDDRVVRGFDRATVERSFIGSLRRLGVERVDILYLHGPQPGDLTDELLRFLEDQKTAGRIGFAGVESGSPATFELIEDLPIDVAMLHYNVGDPSTDALIARLVARGTTVISGTALAQGKFSAGTFVPTSRRSLWYLLRLAKNDPLFWWRGPALARKLRDHGGSAHAAAIGFVAGHPLITSALFGSTSPAHVLDNAKAGHKPMTEADRLRLLA